MEKYIYKITNLINNKVYIGQTKDLHKRWKGHCDCASDRRYTNYLYNAMRKYGIDNFKMEVIEGPIPNYNEREKYWISYYNSYLDKNKGYNMTPGGEDPPILSGDKSSATIYNEETISQIQFALINNKLSYDEISKKFEISKEYLGMINRGASRKNNELSYPLRKNGNERKDPKLVLDVANSLLYTTKSIEQLSREYKVGANFIYDVNEGLHFQCVDYINYPIRNPHCRFSNYLLDSIYNDLLDNKLKFSDIEKKYSISKISLSRINQGKIYNRNNFSYPLRPSNKRVYKSEPVTTIPSQIGSRATIDTQRRFRQRSV